MYYFDQNRLIKLNWKSLTSDVVQCAHSTHMSSCLLGSPFFKANIEKKIKQSNKIYCAALPHANTHAYAQTQHTNTLTHNQMPTHTYQWQSLLLEAWLCLKCLCLYCCCSGPLLQFCTALIFYSFSLLTVRGFHKNILCTFTVCGYSKGK